MNTNAMMTNLGLYSDVIGLINEYCNGDRQYWRSKYDQVVFTLGRLKFHSSSSRKMDPFLSDTRKKLCRIQRKIIRRKIRVVLESSDILCNGRKTVSIKYTLDRYNVVGIYRIAFDKAVDRIIRTMRITQSFYYTYIMNINRDKDTRIGISQRLFRHLQDYNYTEFVNIFSCRYKLWAVKLDWGTLDMQAQKRKINTEILNEGIKRKRKQYMIEQETENILAVGYRFGVDIDIIRVHKKSINLMAGDKVVNKRINVDKKTGRIYICNPLKKGRLYADEKVCISK
jgi:hypothetical protein